MSNKGPHRGYASFYANVFPKLREKAYELGYALALHGSLVNDLDVIAVPWTEAAVSDEELAHAIAEICGAHVCGDSIDDRGRTVGKPVSRSHGRMTWTISFGAAVYIDLSVMPRVAAHVGAE